MTYNFIVDELDVKCTNSRKIIYTDSVEYHYAKFEFPEEWDDYDKTIVFKNTKTHTCISMRLDEFNTCVIPWEVIKDSGDLVVAVEFINGTVDAWTKMKCPIMIIRSDKCPHTEEHTDPTPDIYEQIVTEQQAIKTRLTDVESDLDNKGDNLEYADNILSLKSGERVLSSVEIRGGGGGTSYTAGDFISIVEDVISATNFKPLIIGDSTFSSVDTGIYQITEVVSQVVYDRNTLIDVYVGDIVMNKNLGLLSYITTIISQDDVYYIKRLDDGEYESARLSEQWSIKENLITLGETFVNFLENPTQYITQFVTPEQLEIILNNYAKIDDIPTNTSDLTNDSGFIDKDVDNLTNYYTKTEVDTEIGNIRSDLEDYEQITDQAIENKQDKLTDNQISNINDVPNIQEAIGKVETHNLLDIPDWASSTTDANLTLTILDNELKLTVQPSTYLTRHTVRMPVFMIDEDGIYTVKLFAKSGTLKDTLDRPIVQVNLREGVGTGINRGAVGGIYRGIDISRNNFSFLKDTPYHLEFVIYETNQHIVDTIQEFTFNLMLSKGSTIYDEWEAPNDGYNSVPDLINKVNSNTAEIEELKNRTSDLPKYVIDEIERVKTVIDSKLNVSSSMFGFSTDQHLSSGDMSIRNAEILGLKAMNTLSKSLSFDFNVLGGDVTLSSSEINIFKDSNDVNAPFMDNNIFTVSLAGNHDAYQNNPNTTMQKVFNMHTRRMAERGNCNYVYNMNCNSFYDDETKKIRYIFLNSNSSTLLNYTLNDIRQWLENTLESMPNEYQCVIFSHHPINGTMSISKDVRNCREVLLPYANRIIACISGHTHRDESVIEDGILFISTVAAQTNQDVPYSKILGTATETAFDTFIVDTTNKKIYAVRYGAGADQIQEYYYTDEGQTLNEGGAATIDGRVREWTYGGVTE